MRRFIIAKASRTFESYFKIGSYQGPTFDKLGKDRWKPYYLDKNEAEQVAKELSKLNPVGFVVVEVPE